MSVTLRMRCVTKHTLETAGQDTEVALGFALLKPDDQPVGMGGADFMVRVPLADAADIAVEGIYLAPVTAEGA